MLYSYEEFKAGFVEKLVSEVEAEEDKHVEIDCYEVDGMDTQHELFCLKNTVQDKEENTYSPINLTYLFQWYQTHGSLEKTVDAALFQIWMSANGPEALKEINMDLRKVIFDLVNTAANQELLVAIPNRPFLDMSIVYRLVVSNSNDIGLETLLVTNEIMQEYGKDEQSLFESAYEYTKKILPMECKLVTPVYEGAEMPDIIMIQMSNTRLVYGASNLIYRSYLRTMAEHWNSDIYFYADSSDAALLVPAAGIKDTDPLIKEFLKLSEATEQEAILSDTLYIYKKDSDIIHEVAVITYPGAYKIGETEEGQPACGDS